MPTRSIKRTNARNRAALDPSVPKRVTPAVISMMSVQSGGTELRLTFSGRVMARELPGFKAGAGGSVSPTAMTQTSGTVVELRFGASVAGSNLIVPEGDPGIRTPSGGFVPAGKYLIPTSPA